MKNALIAITVVIVLIIIFIAALSLRADKIYGDYLYGYWEADDAFCDAADIDSMMIFIGPRVRSGRKTTHTASIVIAPDISQQAFEINYNNTILAKNGMRDTMSRNVDLEFSQECQIPNRATLSVNIFNGSLSIHDGETIFAKMYKNNEVTSSFV